MSSDLIAGNMAKTSCFFVDFDGTLIDSISSLYRAYSQLLGLYGICGSKEEFNTLNGPSTLEIVNILKSKYQLPDDPQTIYMKYIDIINLNYENSEPFLDAEFFLSKLYANGAKLVLVTSCLSETCLAMIEKFGWKAYFSDFVWGESVKASKPSPEIYIEAYRRSGFSKNEIIVIEDSVNGVRAAHDAGLVVIGLNIDFSADALIKAGAERVFHNLTGILGFL